MRKDFEMNTTDIYSILDQEPQKEEPEAIIPRKPNREALTDEELKTARELNLTQGRKGAKAKRINMAFSPEIYDYITTMARVTGETITQFTNEVFKDYMENHRELYDKAKEFKNSL